MLEYYRSKCSDEQWGRRVFVTHVLPSIPVSLAARASHLALQQQSTPQLQQQRFPGQQGQQQLQQQPNSGNMPETSRIPLCMLTPELRKQIHDTVKSMLRCNMSHISVAKESLDMLMEFPDQWQQVFADRPILQTLYKSNHHVFSIWHPQINAT